MNEKSEQLKSQASNFAEKCAMFAEKNEKKEKSTFKALIPSKEDVNSVGSELKSFGRALGKVGKNIKKDVKKAMEE